MHEIKSIGPVLGIVAFVGLAVLAFLLFQQARDLRRLRDWAGRAPERAQEAADATQAVADASRAEPDAQHADAAEPASRAARLRARLTAFPARVRGAVAPRISAVDRRLPIDGRFVVAIAAIAAIAAAVATSGFGLVGGGGSGANGEHKHRMPNVAVLNGTPVANLAAKVDKEVVRHAGYRGGTVGNVGAELAQTVVMYAPGHRADAKALATAIQPQLGKTPTEPITPEVKSQSGSARLAIAVGLDDSQFGG
jgi:hypothetical protein